jgi:hypothetical protein
MNRGILTKQPQQPVPEEEENVFSDLSAQVLKN